MGTTCSRCGQLKPHFATGTTEGGLARLDSGTCMSCRQGKRPGAQVKWDGDVKALLVSLNARRR